MSEGITGIEYYYLPRILNNTSSTSVLDTLDISIFPIFAEIKESVLGFLKSRYCEIRDMEDIKDFLIQNSKISNCLWVAPDVIYKYFGETNLSLELSHDPEIENDEGELFLKIITKDEPKEALKKLNELDKKWLLPIIMKEEIYNFNTDLEFK